jgi:hypothetical protein
MMALRIPPTAFFHSSQMAWMGSLKSVAAGFQGRIGKKATLALHFHQTILSAQHFFELLLRGKILLHDRKNGVAQGILGVFQDGPHEAFLGQMVVHEPRFAQPRGLSQHTDRGAVVAVLVENLPAAVQEFLLFNFFNWHIPNVRTAKV